MNKNKRALSPVIATVLLILIAVILAVIILLWAKNFIKEDVQKTVGNEAEPIQNFCDDIDFSADVYNEGSEWKVSIENRGDIPLYGVEIRKKGLASVKVLGEVTDFSGITSGDTVVLTSAASITSGNNLLLVPILLGESKEEKKSYVCDEQYGVDVTAV